MIRRQNKNRLVAWLPEQHINGIVIALSKAASQIDAPISAALRVIAMGRKSGRSEENGEH